MQVNQNSNFKYGLIIVETPHQGCRRVWSALDQIDFVDRTNASVGRSDTSGFDLETVDGCHEWNSHNLRSYRVYKFEDAEEIISQDDPKITKEALFLNWIEESDVGE